MGETTVALESGRPGEPARAPALSAFTPVLLVIAAGLAFAVVIWAGLLFHLQERERLAFAAARRDASNLVLALEEQVERTIVGLDQVLRFTQGEIADKGQAFDLRSFARRLPALDGVSHQISVVGSSGLVVGTSLDLPPARPVDVSDREHFQVHRDDAHVGLSVSRPVLGRASGRWSIQLSRRLNARDGSFAGIVVISLDPDYLSRQFAGIDVGPGGAITLSGRDGFVRARSPLVPGLYEGNRTTRSRTATPDACADIAPGRTVNCRFASSLDGLDRLHAFRALGSLPLIVSVGVSAAAVEAGLAAERRGALWLGSSVSLALAGALWLLVRELERRRRREAELRDSEVICRDKSEQLQATLDNMDQGLLVVDAAGRVPVCNQRAMTLLDLPPELMASTPAFAEVTRHQVEQNEFAGAGGAFRTWVAGGGVRPEFDVYRRIRPNGIALEIRTVPLPGGGAVRTYTDITAANMAEEDLRFAKDFAESLLRSSPDCIKVLDLQGRLTFINAAGRCLLELEELQVVDGLSFVDLFPAGSRDIVKTAVGRAIGGDGSRFAAFCPTAKGTPKWWDISVAPVRGRGGAIDKLLVVSRDMTDRRAAEQAVRDSEARLQAALDAGRMYAWERDPASGFVARSPNAASVLGLCTGETWTASDTFDSFLVHVHPEDRDRVEAETAAALDEGAPYAVEFRWRRPDDGRVIWLSDVGRRTRDPLTGCERFLGLCSDVTRRKDAEEALARKTALLEATLDNMDQGLVMVAPDGGVVVANRRFAELLDLPPELLPPSRPDFDDLICHLADAGEFAADPSFPRRARGAPLALGTFERRRANGNVLEIRTVPLSDGSGAVIRTYADVTARREAEAALRAAEADYRALFENSVVGIYRSSPEGRMLRGNPALARLNGYESEAEHVAAVNDIATEWYVDPTRRDTFKRLMAEKGRVTDFVSEIHRHGTRERIWVSETAWAIRDARTGAVTAYEGTVLDATERRQAEAALADSEARYRLLADNVSDLIVLYGADGRRSYISPAVTPMLGYTVEEARSLPLRAWVHPDDLPRALAVTRGLTAAQPRGDVVYRLKRKDGGLIWAEAAFQRLADRTTGEVKILAAIRDVSERQAQADALREAKDAAEAASEAKTEFLASMSHEIRTPLNGILGYADLLLDDPALNEGQRRHLQRIQTAGSALLTVVNDVLDLSKIEAGQVELEPQPFSLAALVDNTVSITRGLADRKGLELRIEIDPDLPEEVVGDQDRLRQVLLNLLNNAIKFTQAGSIALRLAIDGDAPEDGCRVRFSVADTGIGIPKDKIGRLFQRFSQIDGSSRRKFGGTGLGLAISKHLVELMGGAIGVESEHLRGAAFWFSVPLPRASAVREEAGPARAAPDERAARLLLVEDLDINQELACAVLTAAGHAVDVVGDGADAVMAVQAKAYDLVLMDIQMPGMDGITATRHIRALRHPAAGVPVVAMTANVLPQQVAQFRLAGMNDHVGKPFKRDELLAAIQRCLPASEPVRDGPAEAPPALDGSAFADVQGMLGREKVHGLLGGLHDRLTAFLSDAAAGAEDPGEIAREAHRLVSVAGMLGFRQMSDLCAALETACGAGSDIGALLSDVRVARARALDQIRALREAA